jgi:cellulose synthase/poly-beta-1,6-N-acetylglucosamine synthase-like glycosyltransferase
MLIHTLNALALLDYPHYEVIVVDNNTKDEKIWRPVEEHCRNLGDRFHFYHVDPLTGFKAGALNYALRYTDKAAELIAVIDSDYVVDKKWLRDLVPSFNDPAIAIVQAPQDYRDGEDNTFKAMCYAEYQGFFQIGMVTRNERNAIIQHGTMTMIRRSTLKAIKGWAEWCITEDTELGLRIFEQGMKAAYTPHSYGRGLIPDTFMDYKKQRYRWAYGAMQIMKRHLRELLHPDASRLSMGQRYHFIAGWLPWLAQSANLVFSVLAIAWSVGMMYAPAIFEAPHLAFSIFPIMFFSFNLVKHYHLYRYRLGKTPEQTLAAAIAGLSLSHTIGKAMLYGLFTSDQPFIRTPKRASPHVLSVAMASAFEEILLFATFMLTIFTLTALPRIDSPDFTLWLTLLTIQSIPYAAALITSLISACLLPTPVSEIEETTNTRYSHETNKQ